MKYILALIAFGIWFLMMRKSAKIRNGRSWPIAVVFHLILVSIWVPVAAELIGL